MAKKNVKTLMQFTDAFGTITIVQPEEPPTFELTELANELSEFTDSASALRESLRQLPESVLPSDCLASLEQAIAGYAGAWITEKLAMMISRIGSTGLSPERTWAGQSENADLGMQGETPRREERHFNTK